MLRTGETEIYPEFKVGISRDIFTRGGKFYAIWDESTGLWSTDISTVQKIIDNDLRKQAENMVPKPHIRTMENYSNRKWAEFLDFLKDNTPSNHQLDEKIVFQNDKVVKTDYVSRRLPYPLEKGDYSAWDEFISTVCNPEEREKIEWAIGAIVSGDSKYIQKFIVLYGEPGSGKSTILDIIEKLFPGYCSVFDSEALTSKSDSFSTEVFKSNPLIAIEHDGDLSRIGTLSRLNSIASHEPIVINEKNKGRYQIKVNAFMFIGTNKPVKISDQKAGIIRRLIDVKTSGRKLSSIKRFLTILSQINFELGAIAYHCLEVYRTLGKDYYFNYRPIDMMLKTDVFFNFIEAHYHIFIKEEMISLSRIFDLYRTWCEESAIQYRSPRYTVREEAKNYWRVFHERYRTPNSEQRSIFEGFRSEIFSIKDDPLEELPFSLVLDSQESLFDIYCFNEPAQYATDDGIPAKRWVEVTTTLADLDTTKLHYVKLPSNHIVIDFDLTDEKGEKSPELNLEEASKWPPTYAEFSKSKKGIHLHYIYDGDPDKLVRLYSKGIEIKVFNGDASLRRQLSKCNNVPIAHLNSGLPLKGETKMINAKEVTSEKGLKDLIDRNLKKEIMHFTRPSIDFIYKILNDAYESGMKYDLTTMRPKVLAFAMKSTNQADYCVKLVSKMKFQSKEMEVEKFDEPETYSETSGDIVFFDTEVYPNLFIVCYKYEGPDKTVVRMINPEAKDIESLFKLKLVGFNNRDFDNHILYGRYLGLSLSELAVLSQKIIGKSQNAKYRSAYNLSYADIYDFSSKKQGLKKFQIELGLEHKELNLPFDEDVPEDKWMEVADYCVNDVIATEAVFNDRKQDFIARQILADLSGLPINETTQKHTAQIIFGNDPNPQAQFNYVDLSIEFPGYKFENGVSSYKGEDPGEGGYVYAEPGIYKDVALLDVASMHPSSIIAMNMFGKYTPRYKELHDARIAIKHKDYAKARGMLGGILEKYLTDPEDATNLAYALKIHALNIVYGLTSASFPNRFKDPRNIDNIVAKRGALFMIDLKKAVQEYGFTVAHIKTDSIKIPNATPEITNFVMEFGKKYGYTFEFEDNYERFCLVNDAVYIAKHRNFTWTAVGAQFAHPYVFKTLFSKEPIVFEDLCEMKSVSSKFSIHLDYNEGLKKDEHNYVFIGRVGSFCPVKEGCGGGLLMSKRSEQGDYVFVLGTKGYRWKSSDIIKSLDLADEINYDYFNDLVDKSVKTISKFGDFDAFVAK